MENNKPIYKKVATECVHMFDTAYIERRESVNTETGRTYNSYYLCMDTPYGVIAERIDPYKNTNRFHLICDIIARGSNG